MQGIESFIDALSLYVANNILAIVFLIAALYILKKSNQKQRKYLITVAVLSVLFVFNGITFAVVKWMGEDTTYYRFFWICPVVLVSAYLVVELLFEEAVKRYQRVALLAIFGIMVFGNYGQSFSGWGNIPSNIYQIDEDIIQLGDFIDEQTGGERTILLVNDYIAGHIREYNANIVIHPDTDLGNIINGDDVGYVARNVMMFMEYNRAEYIAVEKGKIGTNHLFQSIGCEKRGETDNFNVYYYDYDMHEEELEIFKYGYFEKNLFINSEYIHVPRVEEQKDYLYVTDLWVNTSEEQKLAIIDLANKLQVEAVIINSKAQNTEITADFLEAELEGLKVPYIYNNHGIQVIDEEEYMVLCVSAEGALIEEFEKYTIQKKPILLVLDKEMNKNNMDEETVLTEDCLITEVIVYNSGFQKEVLNNSILIYGAPEEHAGSNQRFVTLLRVKGLEAERCVTTE